MREYSIYVVTVYYVVVHIVTMYCMYTMNGAVFVADLGCFPFTCVHVRITCFDHSFLARGNFQRNFNSIGHFGCLIYAGRRIYQLSTLQLIKCLNLMFFGKYPLHKNSTYMNTQFPV